jgi:hypothetical protein
MKSLLEVQRYLTGEEDSLQVQTHRKGFLITRAATTKTTTRKASARKAAAEATSSIAKTPIGASAEKASPVLASRNIAEGLSQA